MSDENSRPEHNVRHFRQILLWPLQLMPIRKGAQIQRHWELLERDAAGNPWRCVEDEFTGDPGQFQERHYSEFVAFLPYVQRFLYGEGGIRGGAAGESPIRVFRRGDVTQVRLVYPGDRSEAIVFNVAHVDLYFFFDIDVAVLVVEISAPEINLDRAHETLYRFGRAYPTHWSADGQAGYCLQRVEWLSSNGEVLATSDYERREKYLEYVDRYRAPCIASHWEYLLRPLVPHHSDEKGLIRYRQIEYHRMPMLAYLSFDDPRKLTRGDFVRLALVTMPTEPSEPDFSGRHSENFESRYCYDRYWNDSNSGSPGTRYMCCGDSFTMVDSDATPHSAERGSSRLEQFRHQFFLLFLIPHFHKAALLMLSDRLGHTLNRLDIQDAESVRHFKRNIRQLKEIFLRFTHRYWFNEISDQALVKQLYSMCNEFLGTEHLYMEVRQEIHDMSEYLDSDSLRRQANTVTRLTVVTIFGLIGTMAVGFLGMNLIAANDSPLLNKFGYFAMIFIPTAWLTLYTIVKSKRLSDFLEALADERLTSRAKFSTFLNIWRKTQRPGAGQ